MAFVDRTLRIGQNTLAALHLAGLLACLPVAVNAQVPQCTIQADTSSIGFNAVSVGRDTPAGTPISDIRSASNMVNCPVSNTGNPNTSGFYLQLFSGLQVSSVVPDVWETGTPGIGVRVISVDFGNKVVSINNPGGYTDFGPVRVSQFSPYVATLRFTYQLIKTGQASGNGQVSVAQMYNLQSHNIARDAKSGPRAPMALAPTSYTARSCTITTPNISVSLPNVSASALRSTGVSAGRTPFSIGLQCQGVGSVYITLTDATTPANRTDLLTLTGDSTAGGVGIRIRNSSSTAVSFGPDSPVAGNTNQWLVGPSDTTTSIPLSAEYVSTGSVTPGTVRALATFTMSYQ